MDIEQFQSEEEPSPEQEPKKKKSRVGKVILYILFLLFFLGFVGWGLVSGYFDRLIFGPEVTPPVESGGSTLGPTKISGKQLPEVLNKPKINIVTLEQKVFNLINEQRTEQGLSALKWNEDVAKAARGHSQYLAGLNHGFVVNLYIDHKDASGHYHDTRLNNAGIYYFSSAGENIHASSIIHSYYDDDNHTPARYYTQNEMAENSVTGWMNSPGHRENILNGEYDETGVGIAVDPTETNYVFTQVFIKRAACGYLGGSCCKKTGYYDYCFEPWSCVAGKCQ